MMMRNPFLPKKLHVLRFVVFLVFSSLLAFWIMYNTRTMLFFGDGIYKYLYTFSPICLCIINLVLIFYIGKHLRDTGIRKCVR